MINYRESPGMLRMLRAEAAKVREQNQRRPLPRLTWTPPTIEPVDAEQIAS